MTVSTNKVVPSIDYTARDYQSIRDALVRWGTQRLPQWSADNEGDFGLVLVEMMAYLGDLVVYAQERLADESYLSTARQRGAILEMARMLGYVPAGYQAAFGSITVVNTDVNNEVLLPAWTGVSSGYSSATDSYQTFETYQDAVIPVATGVSPNQYGSAVIGVVHGRTTVEQLGVSTGQANQVITLPDYPIVEPTGLGGPGAFLRLYTVVEDPSGLIEVPFTRVDNILMATSTEMAFSAVTDVRGGMILMFGDGINGAIPPQNLPLFATYRVGGGYVGNLTSNSLATLSTGEGGNFLVPSDFPTLQILSSTEMSGGQDQETIEQIRINAPRAWRTQGRAVALSDFETLALQVPGVLKAKAFGLNYTNVILYVATTSPTIAATQTASSQTPSPQITTMLENYLSPRTLVGTTVTISGFSYAEVYIGSTWDKPDPPPPGQPPIIPPIPDRPLTVFRKAAYSNADIETRVTAAITELFSFENVQFGMVIPLSLILHTVMKVDGVLFAQLDQITWQNAVPIDDPSLVGTATSTRGPNDGANDIRVRYDQLPYLTDLNLTVVEGDY